MASLPRRKVPPPMSTTASGSNNAVMPSTSPAFSLATNSRSKSWGSLAGSLVVKSFIVTLLIRIRRNLNRPHEDHDLYHVLLDLRRSESLWCDLEPLKHAHFERGEGGRRRMRGASWFIYD